MIFITESNAILVLSKLYGVLSKMLNMGILLYAEVKIIMTVDV